MGQSTTDIWIYQTHTNTLLIGTGQRVAIYCPGADASCPGNASGAIVEGRLGDIEHYNKDWVTFQIHNTIEGVPTLLCVPAGITNPTPHKRMICRLINFRRFWTLGMTLYFPNNAMQNRRSMPSAIRGVDEEWVGGEPTETSQSEGDPASEVENDGLCLE